MDKFYCGYTGIDDNMGGRYYGPVDEHGKKPYRTKVEWPYSYSAFVQERVYKDGHLDSCIYTARLHLWYDHKKLKDLEEKHFGNRGDYWNRRSAKQIEAFLQELKEDPSIRVSLVMEECNVGNGYPIWRIYTRRVDEKGKKIKA